MCLIKVWLEFFKYMFVFYFELGGISCVFQGVFVDDLEEGGIWGLGLYQYLHILEWIFCCGMCSLVSFVDYK